MFDAFETDTPQAPAPPAMAFWVEKSFATRARNNRQGGGFGTAAPTDLMAQGAARKRGVSKHLPALGDVSAHGMIGVAARNKAVVDPTKTNNPAKSSYRVSRWR